jgi:tetratricopeptide (TPR) repeat protein
MKINIKVLFIILAVTFVVFLPSLHNGFSNLDDDKLVYQNPHIMSLSHENLRVIFTSFHYFLYTPVVLLSYAIEFHFFKLNPFGYHCTNLCLHLCNVALVFWLILLIGRKRAVGAGVALLFALHPLHVESVAWISERKDVLYAFFYLGSLILYVRYLKTLRARYYCLSLALFFCSLLSKPMALSLPFVLFLLDFVEHRRGRVKNILVEKLPYFAAFAVFAWITLAGNRGFMAAVEKVPSLLWYGKNIGIAHYALLIYLGKLFYPVHLAAVYPLLIFPGTMPAVLFAAVVVVWVLIGLSLFSLRSTRIAFFGMCFFLVTISPAIERVMAGLGMIADRNMYIPSLGIFLVAAERIAYFFDDRLMARWSRRVVAGLLVAVAAMLAVLTWQQCRVWGDNVLLWGNVLDRYPRSVKAVTAAAAPALLQRYPNAPVAFKYRAMSYVARGDRDRALADLTAAVALNPRYDDALLLRGYLYTDGGNYDAAVTDFMGIMDIPRARDTACIGMGNVLLMKHEYKNARAWYTKAITINPANAQGYLNRGKAFVALEDFRPALADLGKALTLAPYLAEAHVLRGDVQQKDNDPVKSIEEYTAALQLQPSAAVYTSRGGLYARRGQYKQALDDFTRAIVLDPGFAGAYLNLGTLYGMTHNYDRAIVMFDKALEKNPRLGSAALNRAVCYFAEGDYLRALEDLRKAQELGQEVPQGLWNDVMNAIKHNGGKQRSAQQ